MVKQIITNEESILKRQARRRLLGAIALTILVVTLLPMVLDSEPPKPTQDIDLKIPDKDKVGEFVPQMVLPPLNASDAASQPVTAQPASAPVIVPLLNTKPVATTDTHPKTETKSKIELASSLIPEPKTLQTEVLSKPEVASEKKSTAKVTSKPVAKAHSGFIIQVGAFSNADTAKKLQEKLLNKGYPSYTEKAGNKTRVRVGDYHTHTDADKILRKLEILGYKPNVIKLN